MSGAEIEELESYHESILKKYEYSGVSSLTPSELCLTLTSPSWEYFFFKSTKTHWLSIVPHYRSTLLSHLKSSSDDQIKKKDFENSTLRQQAGKVFLELLDTMSVQHVGTVAEPSLKDDQILDRLKESLAKKAISLMNLLLKNDTNHDGYMSKSELVAALEEIGMTPHDIVAIIRIAGYRAGVDRIPVAGFSDFLTRRGEDRKKEEYALFTKVLNAFNSKDKNLAKVFAFLDTNRDGVISLEELRTGLASMNISMTLAECKEVFTVLDKDRSGAISLDELKKRLNTLSTGGHEAKSDTGQVSGSLEVVVLKGQKFKAGAKTIKVKFGNSEFTSQANAEANPEWKFKCNFEVVNEPLQKLARDVEFEIFSGKKSEGKAVISLNDIRATDVLKSKLDVLVNKQSHGVIMVKSTWTEVQQKDDSGLGNLEITIVRGESMTSDVLFTVENRTVRASAGSFGQTYRFSKLKNNPDSLLIIKKIDDETAVKQMNINDFISENSRKPHEVNLGKTKLHVQIVWEEFDPEEEKEDRAATKIQAAWRGYLVRHNARIKSPRKLVFRQGVSYDKRIYLLAVFEKASEYEIEVHPADTTQVGIDTVLSVNRFPKQDIEELIHKLTLHPNFTLKAVLDKKAPLRGDLSVEILYVKGLPSSIFSLNIGKKNASIVSGSNRPAEFTNVLFNSVPEEINCRVLSSANTAVLGECKIYWAHALLKPEEWTFNSLVHVGDSASFVVRVKWEESPDTSKEELAAICIQKNWRAKIERDEMKIRMRKNTLVGRKGISADDKIYLVSVKETENSWIVELHPADNPQVPTFEIIDSVKVDSHGTIEELLAKVTVEGEKIKIN